MAKEIHKYVNPNSEEYKYHINKIRKEDLYLARMRGLCELVLDENISNHLSNKSHNLTVNQIRTIFNYGYKLALSEVKDWALNDSNISKSLEINLDCLSEFLSEKFVTSSFYENLKTYETYVENDISGEENKPIHQYLYAVNRADTFVDFVKNELKIKIP
jgi:hypothetical protein